MQEVLHCGSSHVTFLFFICLVETDEDGFRPKRKKGTCLLFYLSKKTKLLELLIKLI